MRIPHSIKTCDRDGESSRNGPEDVAGCGRRRWNVSPCAGKGLERYLIETGDLRARENGEIFESCPRYSPIRKFPAREK